MVEEVNPMYLLDKDSAIVIKADIDSEIQEVAPADGEHFSLEEMYKYCNCELVEFVYLPKNKIMVVDEEGLLKAEHKINHVATALLFAVSKNWNPIVGDVMIINESQTE